MKKKISIVLPIFNEEQNILLVFQQIIHVFKTLTIYDYEIIFVDDGSVDASWNIISCLSKQHHVVKALRFSRNFGHQRALIAGYKNAQGDAIISMDADLQDPPQLIPSLIKEWERGYPIVYARRKNRNDRFLKKHTAKIYYWLLNRVSTIFMPRNVGDFRLLDKKVIVLINELPEQASYLRGLVAWTGFAHTFVDFERPNRQNGTTGYSWKKMFKLGFDGLTSFSLFPLKLSGYVAFFNFIIVCLYVFVHSISFFSLFILIGFTMQSVCIWLLGEYLGRIYEQQKGRPLYIIQEKVEKSIEPSLIISQETHEQINQ